MIGLLAVVGLAGAGVVELAWYDLDSAPEGFFDRYSTEGTPQWALGSVGNGPGGGYDGPNAWSTGLLADYLNDSANCLEVPVPALDGAARPMFSFYQWYAIASGDLAQVQVDPDGSGWQVVEPVYGYPAGGGWVGGSGAWEQVGVDLAAFGPTPRVCLLFAANDDGVVDDGWFVDNLGFFDGDVVPPRVDALDTLPDTEDLTGPYEVRVETRDDVAVVGVDLHWSAGGGEQVLEMEGGATSWVSRIPGQPPDTTVKYWAFARDAEGNTTRAPVAGERSFRVYLPAPVGLDGPDGRIVASTATLTWSAPDSTHPVRAYAVLRDGLEVARTEELRAEVPLTGAPDTFVVRAEYDAGLGDPSEPVVVDGLLPEVVALSPAEGFPGDLLRLALTGEFLLMVDGQVSADFDGPVTVLAVEVRDVDLAYLSVEVDGSAAAGPVALSLTTPVGTLVTDDAFSVRDEGDRPRLTAVSPESLRQGASAELVVTLVGDLAGPPAVDAGEGVVIESVEVGSGEVRVAVVVANDAPLGDHPIIVDDGVRRYTGVSLEVKDAVISLDNGCHSAPRPATALLGLFGGAALLLRRRSSSRG